MQGRYIFLKLNQREFDYICFFLKCPIYQFKKNPKHNLVLKTNRNEKKSLLNNWERKKDVPKQFSLILFYCTDEYSQHNSKYMGFILENTYF